MLSAEGYANQDSPSGHSRSEQSPEVQPSEHSHLRDGKSGDVHKGAGRGEKACRTEAYLNELSSVMQFPCPEHCSSPGQVAISPEMAKLRIRTINQRMLSKSGEKRAWG